MQKPLSLKKQNSEIEKFIIYLITLLENWNKYLNIAIIQLKKNLNILKKDKKKDFIKILIIKINLANIINYN